MEEFLQQKSGGQLLVLGVSVPTFGQHDIFRSHKVCRSSYPSESATLILWPAVPP